MATSKTDGDFLSLTVTLGGRPYPLRVVPEDEEPIRRIAKELNAKLTDFQGTYPGRDKQDCLAMLLLIYAVDLYKVKDGRETVDPKIGRSLTQLESTLKAALESTS
ncbi:MAG: cell division protein ZapA [Saprospiraceae bacterium]